VVPALTPQEQMLVMFREQDTASLCEMYKDATAQVNLLQNQLTPHREVQAILQKVFVERMQARNSRILLNDDVLVQLVPGPKPSPKKNIDILWQIRDVTIDGEKIPEAVLKPALYIKDPEPEEKRRECNLTEMKKLLPIYGGEVKELFDKGVIYPEPDLILHVEVKEHALKAES